MNASCKIAGPYLPVGDTDWECRTHGVPAELRDPRKYGGDVFRRGDFYCPLGQPLPTVDEAVAVLVDTEVARAVDCYAHGMPGHGEYLLVRLGMRLARLERVVDEARDVLDRS